MGAFFCTCCLFGRVDQRLKRFPDEGEFNNCMCPSSLKADNRLNNLQATVHVGSCAEHQCATSPGCRRCSSELMFVDASVSKVSARTRRMDC